MNRNRNRYLTSTPCSVRLSHDTIARIRQLADAANICPSEWIRNKIETNLETDDKMILVTKLFEILGVKDIQSMAKIMDYHKKQIINNDVGEKTHE